MTLDAFKAHQRELWSSGAWERLAATMSDIHDDLVAGLAPRPGEQWLDLATGTGAVAIRAARAGASVTGQDLSPRMLSTARRLSETAGTPVKWEEGDAENLPYGDDSFDVVSSAFGVTFTRDHVAVAREIARVCRSGGRLGLVDWETRRHRVFEAMISRFIPPKSADARAHDWGRRDHVQSLLGAAFELRFVEGESPWRAVSGEASWCDYVAGNGQAREWIESLPAERKAALRRAWISYFEAHRTGGGVAAPREYLLVLGTRRN